MSFLRPTASSSSRQGRVSSLRPAPRPIIPASEMPQQNEVQRRSAAAAVVAPVTLTLPPNLLPAAAAASAAAAANPQQQHAPRSRLSQLGSVGSTLRTSTPRSKTNGGTANGGAASRYAFSPGGRLRPSAQELDTVERLGAVLETLNRKVQSQIAQARQEVAPTAAAAAGAGSGGDPSLVKRAMDLNRRLEVLKQKLRIASEFYSAEQQQLDELRAVHQAHAHRDHPGLAATATTTTTNTHVRANSIAVRSSTTTTTTFPFPFAAVDASPYASAPTTQQEWQVVLQRLEEDPADAPRDYVCPISQCVMVDPVRTVDGHCYDRSSIAEWFMTFDDNRMPTSPMTNLPLASLELTPDVALREKILAYLREVRAAKNGAAAAGGPAVDAAAAQPSLRDAPREAVVRNSDEAVAAAALATAPTSPTKVPDRGCSVAVVPGSAALPVQTRVDLLAPPPPPPPPPLSFSSSVAAARTSSGAASAGGPIWSSSVVPSSEPHARALNLLRLDDTIELPQFVGARRSAVEMAAAAIAASSTVHHQTSAAAVTAATASSLQRHQQLNLQMPARSHPHSSSAAAASAASASAAHPPRSLNQRRVPSSHAPRRL